MGASVGRRTSRTSRQNCSATLAIVPSDRVVAVEGILGGVASQASRGRVSIGLQFAAGRGGLIARRPGSATLLPAELGGEVDLRWLADRGHAELVAKDVAVEAERSLEA